MNAIEIKKLEKVYKDNIAVNKIDLNINSGELFSLLGVNGAGKTTTIKMLTGLIKNSSGTALVLGKDLNNLNLIKEYLNVSPQETAIASNLTVKENLEFISGVYKINDKSKVDILIKEFKLDKVKNKRAKTLSGGWMRRLSIAMSLINEPKLLFLDEPTLGLDVLARRELWEIIKNLKGKTTIILTTHYMEEAEILSDRVAVMVDGNIKVIGTPKELIKNSKAKNFEDAFIYYASEVN